MDGFSATYAPLASGERFTPYSGFEGVPGFGGGTPASLLFQLAAAPVLSNVMGSVGLTPMGLMHDQNVRDVLEHRRFTEEYRRAIRNAAASERENYMRMAQGLARLAGVPFGGRQREAAGAIADTAVAFAPTLAEIAPDFLDQLGGLRGSPAVLARNLSLAGRYRRDPVTGMTGMGAEAVTALSRQVYDDFYTRGGGEGLGGLSAGQVGGLTDELVRRGMVRTAGTEGATLGRAVADLRGSDRAAFQRAADNVGVKLRGDGSDLSAAELDKLKLDPAVAERLRSFDAEGVKRSIRTYASAVAAVRDLFGDNGRPNAPMAELVAGLERLTQGSLSQLDPSRLTQIVRQTSELSKLTGVPLGNALMIQDHAAMRAAQLGLEPVFGVHAMHGAMAWGAAYRMGGGAAVNAWGRLNPDAQMQLDANLRVQAAGSEMANQMNLAARLSDRLGGFAAGSTAEAFSRAVREGQSQFLDPTTGRVRPTLMARDEFLRTFAGAAGSDGRPTGLTAGALSEMLRQTTVNREYGERYDTAGSVRSAMGLVEVRPWIAAQLGETLRAQLGGVRGVDAATAFRESDRVRQSVTDRVMAMSNEDFASPDRRTREIARHVREALAGTDVARAVEAAGNPEAFYRTTAERFYGFWQNQITRSPYRGIGTPQNMFVQFNDETLRDAERVRLEVAGNVREAQLLAPLGTGSMVRRATQALMDVKEGDPDALKRVVGKAFGGVDDAAVRGRLGESSRGLGAELAKLRDLNGKVSRSAPGAAREALMRQLSEQIRAVESEVSRARRVEEEAGLDTGTTPEDARRAAASADALRGMSDMAFQVLGGGALTQEDTARGRKDAEAALATRVEQMLRSGDPQQALEANALRLRGVTDDDVVSAAGASKARRRFEVTEAEVDAKLKADPTLGGDRGKARAAVLAEGLAARKSRWGKFWYSENGAAARAAAETALSDVQELALGAVMSPQGLRRYGPEALSRYEQTRSGVRELQALAMRYTRGDRSRLIYGDLDVDTTTPEGQAEEKRVLDQAGAIWGRLQGTTRFYAAAAGKAGLAWGEDDGATAAKLGKAGDAEFIRRVGLYRRFTPAELARLEEYKQRESALGDLARRHGTTPELLASHFARGTAATLPGAAQIPADVLEMLRLKSEDLRGRRGDVSAALDRVRKDGGNFRDLDDVLSATADVSQRLDATAKPYRDQEGRGAPELVGDVFKMFGVPDADESRVRQLAGQFVPSRADRENVRRVLETVSYLRRVASKGGRPLEGREADDAVAALESRYRTAANLNLPRADRDRKLSALAADYGVPVDQLGRLGDELDLYRTSGAATAGGERADREGGVARLLEVMHAGGYRAPNERYRAPAEAGGASGPLEIRGNLTLNHDGTWDLKANSLGVHYSSTTE